MSVCVCGASKCLSAVVVLMSALVSNFFLAFLVYWRCLFLGVAHFGCLVLLTSVILGLLVVVLFLLHVCHSRRKIRKFFEELEFWLCMESL